MIAPIRLRTTRSGTLRRSRACSQREGRSSPHYAEHVALLALRLEQIQRFQAVLEMEGRRHLRARRPRAIIIRARPEVAMLSDAMRQAQSLLSELMLQSGCRVADRAAATRMARAPSTDH
jgi:hypothetical protein